MSPMKTFSLIAAAAALAGSIAFTAARADGNVVSKTDRVTAIEKSDRIAAAFDLIDACKAGTCPAARSVTIEHRDEATRTSVLVRMPAVQTANR